MFFSIIIPIYNVEKYLDESIKSILNQNFRDFELILVDDGSTDESGKICDKYVEFDERVKVIHKKNEGSGSARNTGIASAKGKYCYFPDSDDILAGNALEKIYKEINEYEADIYVFSYMVGTRNSDKTINIVKKEQYSDAEVVRKKYEKYMYDDDYSIQGAPWNKVFKTSIIKEKKVEYPNLKRHQDEVFIARYMDKITKKVKISSQVIYKYFKNDVRKEWEKFPRNYFDIRTAMYDELSRIMEKWNEENIYMKCLLKEIYINRVLKCFEFTYNPKWQMNYKKRKQYIYSCISDNKVIAATNFLITNKKDFRGLLEQMGRKKYQGFDEWQLKLIINKKIKTLILISRIKVLMRKILSR